MMTFGTPARSKNKQILRNRNMEESITSDVDYSTMAAAIFDDILDKVRNSNLNFHLQISPFSAIISLKKTLIRNKLGFIVPPSSPTLTLMDSKMEFEMLETKNQLVLVENENKELKEKLKVVLEEKILSKSEMIEKQTNENLRLNNLDEKLKATEEDKIELQSETNKLRAKLGNSEKKNKTCEDKIKNLKDTIASIKSAQEENILFLENKRVAEINDLKDQIKFKEIRITKLEDEKKECIEEQTSKIMAEQENIKVSENKRTTEQFQSVNQTGVEKTLAPDVSRHHGLGDRVLYL